MTGCTSVTPTNQGWRQSSRRWRAVMYRVCRVSVMTGPPPAASAAANVRPVYLR